MSAEIRIKGSVESLAPILDLIIAHLAKPERQSDYSVSIQTQGMDPVWEMKFPRGRQ